MVVLAEVLEVVDVVLVVGIIKVDTTVSFLSGSSFKDNVDISFSRTGVVVVNNLAGFVDSVVDVISSSMESIFFLIFVFLYRVDWGVHSFMTAYIF